MKRAACAQGHRWTQKSTYVWRHGYRQCRRCKAADQARRRSHKEQP